MEFNFFNPTAFPTSIGPWGELFAQFYDKTRVEIDNELRFWLSQTIGKRNVTEIGSGTGFISSYLVKNNFETFFNFVEPEKENVKILDSNLKTSDFKNNSNYKVHHCRFEEASIEKQDLIIFPYDSLPMITLMEQRRNIFSKAYALLNKNGKLIIHISTKRFADYDIDRHNQVVTTEVQIERSKKLFGSRVCRRINGTEYIKYISIKNESNSKIENYIARTSIVAPQEIQNLADNVGFKIDQVYSDFYLNTDLSNSFDLIYIMSKQYE